MVLVNVAILISLHCVVETLSQQTVNVLNLNEGDVCRKGKGSVPDHVCKYAENCETVARPNGNRNYTKNVCSLDGSKPIICCPPENGRIKDARRIAVKKCNEYSELVKRHAKNPKIIFTTEPRSRRNGTSNGAERRLTVRPFVVGGREAVPMEFPHMASLGYGETVGDAQWGCGGSLISERWILTAAHCTRVGGSPNVTRWARVGDLNTETTFDNARPKNYRIDQIAIHPDYKPPSLYHDIALFRLAEDVEFNVYARPICLNANRSSNPKALIATGWGSTFTAGPASAHLMKVNLNVVPANQCNNSYTTNVGRNLKSGILDDSMICAGSTAGKDTCGGDSGGPLQLRNVDNPRMFTQFGITSFGKFCGENNTPGVYTRVSKYIPWIEKIAWPEN